MDRDPYLYLPAVLLALAAGFWGLGWGLPSAERTALFLKPSMQTPAFYQKVEAARSDYYKKIGDNPMAYVGRVARSETHERVPLTILSSYSSFLVRTHHGDEQANLVMLSHLNPLQGRWYPHTYAYGGAYIYPLAAYLGVLKALRVVTLIPQASYYYAHPEDIAHVYIAVRAWSVIGLALSVIPLFWIARHLAGPAVAFWAACFFALAPGSVGNAKMAKPHIWAAAWTLSAIYCGLRHKETDELKWLLLAGICFGLGLGTTMSQIAFLPFILWACWADTPIGTLGRLILAGALTLGVYLLTNFTLFNHIQDYRDEMYFLQKYAPFGFRPLAIWDFIRGALLPSLGLPLWVISGAGVGYACLQNKKPTIRALAILSGIVCVYVAFQVQSQSGWSLPLTSRLALALVALGCFFAAWSIQQLPGGAWINGLCGVFLAVQITLYDLHFCSDVAPLDNASQAAIWMNKTLPSGTLIGQTQSVPHVTEFPPVEFSRYKILPLRSPEFMDSRAHRYAVIPEWADGARQTLLREGFTLTRRFATSPIQKLGFSDPFTTANFPLEVYERGKSPSR